MSENSARAALISAVANLQEEEALSLVAERLKAGGDPLAVIRDCQEGLRQVGLRYEQRRYYLAGLIMGGEIFRQVMEMVQPVIEEQVSGTGSGRILLGTVAGDIHDLGKNIVHMLLRCHNFIVEDLGVDVAPEVFAQKVAEFQPHLVGLSCLLTTSFQAMRETVSLLRAQGYQGPIVIGGGQMTEEVCRYVGADHWTTDGVAGVELCRRLVIGRS